MRSWVTVRRHAASSATYSCTQRRRGLQLSAPRGVYLRLTTNGLPRVRADVEPSDTTHTEKNEPIRTNEHTEGGALVLVDGGINGAKQLCATAEFIHSSLCCVPTQQLPIRDASLSRNTK